MVLITGRSDATGAVEGFAAGADDVVAKPFHFEVLLARIARRLARRASMRELRQDNAALDARVTTRAIELGEMRAALAGERGRAAAAGGDGRGLPRLARCAEKFLDPRREVGAVERERQIGEDEAGLVAAIVAHRVDRRRRGTAACRSARPCASVSWISPPAPRSPRSRIAITSGWRM